MMLLNARLTLVAVVGSVGVTSSRQLRTVGSTPASGKKSSAGQSWLEVLVSLDLLAMYPPGQSWPDNQ